MERRVLDSLEEESAEIHLPKKSTRISFADENEESSPTPASNTTNAPLPSALKSRLGRQASTTHVSRNSISGPSTIANSTGSVPKSPEKYSSENISNDDTNQLIYGGEDTASTLKDPVASSTSSTTPSGDPSAQISSLVASGRRKSVIMIEEEEETNIDDSAKKSSPPSAPIGITDKTVRRRLSIVSGVVPISDIPEDYGGEEEVKKIENLNDIIGASTTLPNSTRPPAGGVTYALSSSTLGMIGNNGRIISPNTSNANNAPGMIQASSTSNMGPSKPLSHSVVGKSNHRITTPLTAEQIASQAALLKRVASSNTTNLVNSRPSVGPNMDVLEKVRQRCKDPNVDRRAMVGAYNPYPMMWQDAKDVLEFRKRRRLPLVDEWGKSSAHRSKLQYDNVKFKFITSEKSIFTHNI